MTEIARLRTTFTGFPGAPGVATIYSTNTDNLSENWRQFWANMADSLPGTVHIQVEGGGDMIEDTTGALVGAWSGATPDPVVGSVNGPYAAPVGALVEWLTPTILDGHRVKGKTFIVPTSSVTHEGDGTLNPDTKDTLQAGATDFINNMNDQFCIWHRPRKARAADGSRPAVAARAGGHALVTSSKVPAKLVVLRSRRD